MVLQVLKLFSVGMYLVAFGVCAAAAYRFRDHAGWWLAVNLGGAGFNLLMAARTLFSP